MKAKRRAARLHPFWSHTWIAFTCAPRADWVFSPGAQSVTQHSTVTYHTLRKVESHFTHHATPWSFLTWCLDVTKPALNFRRRNSFKCYAWLELNIHFKIFLSEHSFTKVTLYLTFSPPVLLGIVEATASWMTTALEAVIWNEARPFE